MNGKQTVLNEPIPGTLLRDYQAEIVEILRGNLTPKHMRQKLLDYHENDIAQALELLEADGRGRLYRLLDAETLADVLGYSDSLGTYLAELPIRKQVAVLSRLEITDAVEALRAMDKEQRKTLTELLSDEMRQEIRLLSSFDEDEIGSRMSTNYIAVRADLSIRGVMRELVAQAAENDNVSRIYVLDEDGILVGAIDLKDLIIAREGTPLESIVMSSYPYVYANEPVDACVERIREYSEDSIPVLDAENRLCGVLTSQILTQLVGDTLEEDYARLAGLSSEEDLEEPLHRSIGKRLPWLVILLGLGLLISGVVGLFEAVIAEIAIIVSFQSLVLGMAGNVGTQSLAVTIRVLADETARGRERLRLIWKELRIGMANGLILGLASFLLIGLYLMLLREQAPGFAFAVSACTAVALFISILLSSLAGTAIPMLFQRLHIDPAVASGPFITTVNDLVAVVSYYGFAWILLLNLLRL